ncbi:unannotated protein [freshwater metagenome]|uniref:Unannotated protein n=1 Tax=freshwater metagenome TaxID=449393 RepID=A0A6J7NUP3_9ZZZZ
MPARQGPGEQTVRVVIRAVLFDFGNTLFAHAPLHEVIEIEATALGYPVAQDWARALAERVQHDAHTPQELALQRDLDARVWAERWPVLYAAGDDVVPGLGAAVYRSMHAAAEWVPYVDTVATLATLSALGIPVGIVSNTGWDVRTVFVQYDVARHVDVFVLSCEVGLVKPAAEIFRSACAALGADPAMTLMVGDDPVADAGAVRAGLVTLLVPPMLPGARNGVDAAQRIANVG